MQVAAGSAADFVAPAQASLSLEAAAIPTQHLADTLPADPGPRDAAPVPVPVPVNSEAATPAPVASGPVEQAPAPVPVPVHAEPETAPVRALAPASAAPEPITVPAAEPQLAPEADLSVALQQRGLVMVETSRERAATAPSQPEIPLGRKPRPQQTVPQAPLMQVETRK